MNTSYGFNSYKSHDLNISMRTSSGDTINMDFSNEQSLNYEKNSSDSKETLTFSSMQSFSFSMNTNGIDEQDRKEIDEFMKTAQPFIDDFIKELDEDAPSSPVTQLARQIASIFEPSKTRDDDTKNYIKTNIVEMFDNSLKQIDSIDSMDKIFDDLKQLLEKTLQEFEEFNNKLYA